MNQNTSNPPGIIYQDHCYGLEKHMFHWYTYTSICSLPTCISKIGNLSKNEVFIKTDPFRMMKNNLIHYYNMGFKLLHAFL